MSAKSVIAALTGFLGHHVNDLNNLTDVLAEITGTLPIDSQDKERITSVISTIKESADNITNFLNGTTVTGSDVTIKESDIVEAIANFFNSDAGKSALTNAVKSVEGNVDA
jgi:hypothetical protein